MFGVVSFYSFFFLFLCLFLLFLRGCNLDKKQICVWCFFLLFLLAGLRGETVGGDLDNYFREFDVLVSTHSLSAALLISWHEPGYVILLFLIGRVSPDPHSFIIITSLLSLIGPLYLFNKYSRDVSVSILLYYALGFYTSIFNNVRQSIALSVFFVILPFLLNRSFWKYIIGVIIATSFHYSAIIMLVLYPLVYKPLSFKRMLIYVGVGFFTVYFLFYQILGFASQLFVEKYDPESIAESTEGSGYGLFLLYALIFVAVALFYFTNKKKWDNTTTLMMSFFVVLQMVTMLLQFSAPLFHSMTRAARYTFMPFMTIAIPYMHCIMKKKDMKSALYFVSFAYALYCMIFRIYAYNPDIGSNGQNIIPYVLWDIVIF